MRRVRALGVAFVAVFAIGAMATSGASAHEFEGSSAHILILGRDLLLILTLAFHLHCVGGEFHVLIQTKSTRTLKATTTSTGCTVAVGKVTTKPDEPIVAEYEYNAEGTVTLLKEFTILASLAGIKCTVLFPAQGPLSTVKYENTEQAGKKDVLALGQVQGLESKAAGAGCAETYNTSKTGSSTSTSLWEAATGNLEWK
jgi:hypothetical protein